MIDLRGMRALVCGATRGIGRASAELLAQQGAQVCLVARNQDALRSVRDALAADDGQEHQFLAADFSQPPLLRELVDGYVREHGPIHILVNNTGGPPAGPALAAKPEQFIAAITAHLLCNQELVQAVVPGMKSLGFGRIINIISVSVKTPIADLGVSNTTRGAVASWSKTLAGELGPFGITVNNVLPGFTATERLTEIIQGKAAKTGVDAAKFEADMMADVPARRFADPAETAAAVAFLASREAGYINGINLPVDGGRLPTL